MILHNQWKLVYEKKHCHMTVSEFSYRKTCERMKIREIVDKKTLIHIPDKHVLK